MEQIEAIAAAVDRLEQVHARLSSIGVRTDDRRRHDLIDYRREFAEQIAEAGRLAEPLFLSLGDSDQLRAYREKFSKMRSATALHQANWPAVMLGQHEEDYRASAQNVRNAFLDFATWLRNALRRIKQ